MKNVFGRFKLDKTRKTFQIFKKFGLGMNPEFLKEGKALEDIKNPDRVVLGSKDEKTAQIMREIYEGVESNFLETDIKTAEMIKYASNAFLAAKISFINEIGNMCKKLGIDTYEVADGIGLDKRIGRSFLDSGIGWGGSCFPKDLDALILWYKKENETPEIIQSTVKINERQPLRLIKLLKRHISKINR